MYGSVVVGMVLLEEEFHYEGGLLGHMCAQAMPII